LGTGTEPHTFLGVLNGDSMYGGGWTAQTFDPIAGNATVLTNGTYTLTRVFDDGGPGAPGVIGLMDSPVLNTPTAGAPVVGDTNHDSVVDLTDLNNVLNSFGLTGFGLFGDTDGSNGVDLTDLNNVLNHFGESGVTGISVAGPDDKVWHDGTTAYSVVAKHAVLNAEFGYQLQSDPTFHALLADSTVGSTSSTVDLHAPDPFSWYIKAGGKTYLSDPSLNPQADTTINGVDVRLDHMVTFKLTGGEFNDVSAWVLWWEDLPINAANSAMTDYQDAVYQVVALGTHAGGPTPVPLPAAVYGGFGLMGLLWVQRRVRNRNS
jgi:hypothetical protein